MADTVVQHVVSRNVEEVVLQEVQNELKSTNQSSEVFEQMFVAHIASQRHLLGYYMKQTVCENLF